ncbi:MAG: hypothetical protein U9Q74_05285 [Gemmatimonadota bacterium]|nr:hypothetical protein [Gemmatimonadota bacterium]
MTAPPRPIEGLAAWSDAQLAAVAALQQEGRQSIGEQYRSNVLLADGTFTSDLGAMKVPKEREHQVSQMIGEHRWTFVANAERLLVDIIPATEEAAAALLGDAETAEDEHDEGEGAESLDPPLAPQTGGEEAPLPAFEESPSPEEPEAPAEAEPAPEGGTVDEPVPATVG